MIIAEFAQTSSFGSEILYGGFYMVLEKEKAILSHQWIEQKKVIA